MSRLLQLRFGPLPAEVVRRIEAATAAQLERWVERVLQAESLDAVLDDTGEEA